MEHTLTFPLISSYTAT